MVELQKFNCDYCESEHTTKDLVADKKCEGVMGLYCPDAKENSDSDGEIAVFSYPID